MVVVAAITTTLINASSAILNQGATLTLTGAVNGGSNPGGTLSFLDSGSLLATVALTGGTGGYSINSLAAGYHSLTARYDGDAANAQSTSTGASYVFLMDGANAKTGSGYSTTVTLAWSVAGVGDFDGDGKTDILWRNSASGENYISLMNGITWRADSAYINTIAPAWSVAATGDYDGDGKLDILWRNATTGDNYITFMNGVTLKSSSDFTQSVAPGWGLVKQ